jgi:hypothetical protein
MLMVNMLNQQRMTLILFNSSKVIVEITDLHPKTFDNNRRKLMHLVNLPKKREDSLSEFVVVEKTAMLNTKTEQRPPSTLTTELRLEAGACSLHVPRDVAPQWLGLLFKELAVV